MRTKHRLISIILSLVSVQAFALVPIKHWQTSQGGQVYFVASPGLPMVDIRLVFDAVGAKYGHATNRDTSWVGLRSLTQADLLAQSVDTFQAIISRPQFAQAEFQRIKEQKLIGLKQQQEKPGFIAKKTFYQSIYSEHPYAHLVAGDAESLRQIQLSDIKQFYQQFYVTKNGVLAIVGDLTQQQAWQIAETLFKQLKPGENAEELPQVNLPKKSKTEHIDFPSTQTHILAGMPVLSRKDPDYFPLYVGNLILGGSGLVSLLFNEIREKRGLAYSAYSYFSPLEEAGPFTMGLQTQNKQSNIAIEVMQKTLADFILQGPTEEQLIAAQKNLTGGFVLRFDNNRKLLNYIAMLAFYQLPLDYLDTFSGKVANVTAEQVKSAFQRRVKINLLQIISVGGL